MNLADRIDNDFSYHPPTSSSIEDMKRIRDHARNLAHLFNNLVPDGRELSTALTKLEEAVMHANAGIARHQSEEDPF